MNSEFLVLVLILVIELIWILSVFCCVKTQLCETGSFLVDGCNKNYQHLQHLTFTTNRPETSVNIQDPAHHYLDSESSEVKQAKRKPQRSWCLQTVGFKWQLQIYLLFKAPWSFSLFCPIQEFSFSICTVKPSRRNKKQREELLHLYPGIALELSITGCSNLF